MWVQQVGQNEALHEYLSHSEAAGLRDFLRATGSATSSAASRRGAQSSSRRCELRGSAREDSASFSCFSLNDGLNFSLSFSFPIPPNASCSSHVHLQDHPSQQHCTPVRLPHPDPRQPRVRRERARCEGESPCDAALLNVPHTLAGVRAAAS